jgi:hypothetical protein
MPETKPSYEPLKWLWDGFKAKIAHSTVLEFNTSNSSLFNLMFWNKIQVFFDHEHFFQITDVAFLVLMAILLRISQLFPRDPLDNNFKPLNIQKKKKKKKGSLLEGLM